MTCQRPILQSFNCDLQQLVVVYPIPSRVTVCIQINGQLFEKKIFYRWHPLRILDTDKGHVANMFFPKLLINVLKCSKSQCAIIFQISCSATPFYLRFIYVSFESSKGVDSVKVLIHIVAHKWLLNGYRFHVENNKHINVCLCSA